MSVSKDGTTCRTFIDTLTTATESGGAIATGTRYIQQVSTLPVVAIAGVEFRFV
jgi:hypothetical protein